jgi:hypothetical protein
MGCGMKCCELRQARTGSVVGVGGRLAALHRGAREQAVRGALDAKREQQARDGQAV